MPEKTVKVCAYNVRMKDQYPGEAVENKQRAKLIAGLLAKSDYDVLVFSEAFDNEARAEMGKILATEGNYKFRTAIVGNGDEFNPAKNLGAEGVIFFGGFVPGAIGGFIGGAGLALGGIIGGAAVTFALLGISFLKGRPKSDGGIFIMSRWPIEMQSQIVYRDAVSYDRFAKKGVSWALVNKEGFYFHVFGTHMQSGSDDGTPPGPRPWQSPGPVDVRRKQLEAFRAMLDSVQMYWQPALLAGDLNVDYCFDRDRCADNRPGQDSCCSDTERKEMLRTLRASPPRDLSRYVYTSDPANEFLSDDGRATTLDYVLSSDTHLAPVRSSLETLKPRAPWTAVGGARPWGSETVRRNDLSDHYAVVGTYTFPHRREDTPRFVGVWRCVTFNGKPDTRKHRLTFSPFGASVVEEFDGRLSAARIHLMAPGGPDGGEITLKQLPSNALPKYEYALSANRDFDRYFVAGEIRAHKKPRPQNMLVLRNRERNATYAFESWLWAEFERPDIGGGPASGGGDGPSRGGERGGGPTPGTERPIRER